MGVFLYADELEGRDFFYLDGGFRLCCTEKAKDFIQARKYTNVDFVEIGVTVARGAAIPIRVEDSAAYVRSRPDYRPPPSLREQEEQFKREHPELFKPAPIPDRSLPVQRLSPDDISSCPVSYSHVQAYVEVESASCESHGLRWVRTAKVHDTSYWIWEMDDDGRHSYVYVAYSGKNPSVGMTASNGLSVDDFIRNLAGK